MKSGGTNLYRSPDLGDSVTEYAAQHSTALPAFITEYHAAASAARDDAEMLSSNFQSQLHQFLARAIGAKRVLEVGVYVGYSAMVWSHAVGPDGLVTGLEYSPELAKIAEDALAAQAITNVKLVVGNAAETLPQLTPSEPYDLVFLDADKPAYGTYLTQMLDASKPGSSGRLLRPGALIVADNVLRDGKVVDRSLPKPASWTQEKWDAYIGAIRAFNDQYTAEKRLESFMMPLWDGLTVLRLVD